MKSPHVTIYCAQDYRTAFQIAREVIDEARSPREVVKRVDGLLESGVVTFSCVTDTAVNHIGRLIARRKINPYRITVYYHDGNDWQMSDGYDSDGILICWPYGYFGVNEE